jgi:hypothetical protein
MNGRRMKPSVAPSCCSTAISSRRLPISRRTVLPTTSSTPSPSSPASTSTSRPPKPSQASRRRRQASSCCTSSTSGRVRISAASRAPSSSGVTRSTVGSGLSSSSSASASPMPLSWRNSCSPSAGVRSTTAATSRRARSSLAKRSACAASTSVRRNRPISREACRLPDRRCRLDSARPSPSGSAIATAITPTVSAVAKGRWKNRPRLETSEYRCWSRQARRRANRPGRATREAAGALRASARPALMPPAPRARCHR